ncbi:unnamed protein product [Vicia faba]|uniref:Uncharacterized protein n=1 Tax=Vicia faba TaxID=3906 RepID=A0AAV1APY8_VICFA|nr:unnamed protein product [Vicia faba]
MPPKKNASQQKPRRMRYIIEEVPDSDLFIPMPQLSQVANHPTSHHTPPPMHPNPPLMNPTPPLQHPTPPMSRSFTGLLYTPPGCTPFLPISPTTFISPTGYTPYFNTRSSTYFPMPSMQSSEPIHMELGGSNMPRPMPSEDDHGDTSASGYSSAPGDTSSAPGETSAQEDTSATEEQTRRENILRRKEPQKLGYYHGRLIIWPDSGSIFPHQEISIITGIIKEKYTKFWPSYGVVLEDDRKDWFNAFKEEFNKQLSLQLSQHPKLEPPPGYPVDPALGFRIWYDVSGGKKKNGRVYSAEGYAKIIKRRDRSFRMRLADGE